jgi:F0F1-type ATP synthase membrane subunit c/vacuolar-type H+-ATPase subunit K
MGPLIVAGLALAGAAIGIAQTAASARASTGPTAPAIRATAVLGLAFTQGVGVLGAVVAILAISVRQAGDANSGVVVIVIAGAGAIIGLAILARAGDRVHPSVRGLGLLYVSSDAMLGIVIGVLAATIGEGAAIGPDAVFVALGLVALVAAVAIGQIAGTALVAISTTPSAADEIRRRFITTAVLAQSVGTIAMVAAMALLFVGEGGRPA